MTAPDPVVSPRRRTRGAVAHGGLGAKLARDDRFDPEARRLVDVAAVVDRIYGR